MSATTGEQAANQAPQGVNETVFGFETVDDGQSKQTRVNDVFHSVARRYDLMNDLMSGGLHRIWKDALVARVKPPRSDAVSFKVLDVAGGTGDVAFRIVRKGGAKTHVSVLDINGSMLEVGAERAAERKLSDKLTFIEANAEELPLEDNGFDAYTIAFGIRNVPRIEQALKEAHRVLKPGGMFYCLEFSQVTAPMLDRIYDTYSFHLIPKIGARVTGDEDSYRYLVESIRTFPDQERFATMLRQAGFEQVSYTNYTGGIVALHQGMKL